MVRTKKSARNPRANGPQDHTKSGSAPERNNRGKPAHKGARTTERNTRPTERPERNSARNPERSSGRTPDRDSATTEQTGYGRTLKPSYAGAYFLFGRNSVEAALKNRKRECLKLIGTEKALSDEKITGIRPGIKIMQVDSLDDIASAVPEGAPHQGILLEVRFLPGMHIADLKPREGRKNIILMLDQVTDPQNVGACLRSAAAFGARALITQDRNSPRESGSLARAAAGGLEVLPWLQVPNLSQALGQLRDMGYWHVGLDGSTKMSIRDVSMGENIVIVMGSEGSGLRPLVKKTCDVIAAIPTTGAVESLNVSNAAAITLYELAK